MGKITVIDSCGVSRKVVQSLLTYGQQTIAVAVKHLEIEPLGDIVLVTVGTLDGQTFVFDVKECPEIMHDGHLWRILEAEILQKVMHDCRFASAVLKRQFKVTLRNVFDTQAAYCLMMMEKDLPPRLIHLHHLYEKLGDVSRKLAPKIEESSHIGGGLYWALRPMPNTLIHAASIDVQLLPSIFETISSMLPDVASPFMEELCYAYIHGKFSSHSPADDKSKSTSKKVRDPILRLKYEQKFLLLNTKPQAASTISHG